MTYKATLLKEYKQVKENLTQEIIELTETNSKILNDISYNLTEFDLIQVRRNFLEIEQKEKEIKYCLDQIQEVLKMDNN